MGFFAWLKRKLSPPDPFAAFDDPAKARAAGGPEAGARDAKARPTRRRAKPLHRDGRDEGIGPARFGLDELARRLASCGIDPLTLQPTYHTFTITKRNGKPRRIDAPDEPTKRVQRAILRRVLAGIPSHPAAHGFERGRSVVTNASVHTDSQVVIKMDIRNFFNATRAERVLGFYRRFGWDEASAARLVELTTLRGGLPQGAPTSPRLANLVNYRLDASLAALAAKVSARYTRYADDMTFSLDVDDPSAFNTIIGITRDALSDFGYEVHWRKTLHLRRTHQRQTVTGIVVNDGVSLARETRHWLRAVEHHLKQGRPATLTPTQLAGWRAYEAMIDRGVNEDGTIAEAD